MLIYVFFYVDYDHHGDNDAESIFRPRRRIRVVFCIYAV